MRVEDNAGAVVAELSVGESAFRLANESPDHQNFSPETLDRHSVRMILTVDDPDTAFQQALAAGAKVVLGR